MVKSFLSAVFYFVGHGFEANGQCYLLPIGAPGEGYGPEHCLSMDWVLLMFKDYSPALNLILLDICRRYLPYVSITATVRLVVSLMLLLQ